MFGGHIAKKSRACAVAILFLAMTVGHPLALIKTITGQIITPLLSTGQTIARCQRNILQHCWVKHVVYVWPPCCNVFDMLGVVGSSLKMAKFEPTHNKSQQGGQTRATCCDMLRWHVAIVCRGVSEPESTLWVYSFVMRLRQSSPEPDYKQSLSFHSLDQEAKNFVSLLLVLPRVLNHDAALFLDLLQSMNLIPHVTGTTYEKGRTLDLVITRETDSVLLDPLKIGHFISDHAVVNCSMDSVKPSLSKKSITYRKIKDIDIAAFKENLNSSELMQDSTANSADLDFIAEKYNFSLSKLVYEHAPLSTKVVANKPRLPWFNSAIRSAITTRRRAERKWRSSKQPGYLAEFKKAKNYPTMLMNKARSLYLTNLINENSYDQHKLFKTVNSLLSDSKSLLLPANVNPKVAANNIGNYFVQKVNDIYAKQYYYHSIPRR